MRSISVALSGGGHRASLWGLGALLYLVDAKSNADVTSIASVSGGSITNGLVAQNGDFRAATPASFEPDARILARTMASRGTFQGALPTKTRMRALELALVPFAVVPWLLLSLTRLERFGLFAGAMTLWAIAFIAPLFGTALAKIYGVVLSVTAFAALVFPWVIEFPPRLSYPAARAGIAVAGLLAWMSLIFRARSWVCERAYRSLLFTRDGKATELGDLAPGVCSVFCATDLQSSEHFYFSREFVYGYRFGAGTPGGLLLSTAVQSSACLPGAFSPRWLRTKRHGFSYERADCPKPADRPKSKRFMVLMDGGVYDNMSDQWAQGYAGRRACWPGLASRCEEPDTLLVVNASAGAEWTPMKRALIPALGEIGALLKAKSVLYDQTTAHRRQGLVGRFDRAIMDGKGLKGALVHIAENPWRIASKLAESPMHDRAKRARAVLDALPHDVAWWDATVDANAKVQTTLAALGVDASASLMYHAYILANAACHIVLGDDLLPMPSLDRFRDLCEVSA